MRIFIRLSFFLGLLTLINPSFGQDLLDEDIDSKVNSDTTAALDFGEDYTKVVPNKKKKKVKKKVFYGIKCKKGFTKKGVGDREVIEVFYFLKSYKEPNPYVKKIYVYDLRKQQIVELSEIDKKDLQFYRILHGPYKKIQGGEIIEEGIYYIGTKHGRWEKYAPKKKEVFLNVVKTESEDSDEDEKNPRTEIEYSILLEKEKYYKGWPRESKITFYDGGHTKIKEVTPIVHGKLNGDYFFFKENGEVLTQGKYIDGKKAGIWVEYYPNKKQKQRETKYPSSPYDDDQFEPQVLSEWDEKGNMTISQGQAVEPGKKIDPIKDRYKKNKKK